ncbi:GTP 3',8-cyclase [Methanocorpusculaceae archaeon Sp1]|uniref:Probable GTP 3',8-cyclase n=2 Tax=Methanorbis furvi TaxID=3028299 RepID=A0AAE4MCV8_9EURY|nr:GTP 3',8-cyclase [Methanocorpusculaceae archaeon Sp1]MDV0441178.1 GTP 3',8-cyclase [Methanocorpusculaceae archaeon Ag1]
MMTGNKPLNDDILTDTYGRTISNVRIALTNACNLRCIYCHHEGEEINGCTVDNSRAQMTKEEIAELIGVFTELGVTTLKLTGGEPTLRPDLLDIIRSIPPDVESSMTTNGTLLAKMAKDLKAAGLSRVNVSLDTMRRDRYLKITGRDLLPDVLAGIEAALDAGLIPVKLNMVILKGINDDEVEDFLSYVRNRKNLILQIIELMDVNGWADHIDHVDDVIRGDAEIVGDLEKSIAEKSTQIITRRMHHRRKYCLDGAEVEVVRPMHNLEFCANCNRLRVTSDGKLKPCLLRSDNEVDIRGLHGDELKAAIAKAVQHRSPYFTQNTE